MALQHDLVGLSVLGVLLLLLEDALVFLLLFAQFVQVLLFVFAFVLDDFVVLFLKQVELVS